eukprot:CAMPEP_0176293146 /NCGR_PEP_ID=MMETSP0121_2-20121125/56453_1 /TAXON_ID=160619 /ORGANISM="Kryptoperidinium foliaceum, Strain CCMP 1326" /LENGTH=52 /DNA_ID=CAMNT_0017634089 /DNA_START=7 /DNA_END=161 /DNA_ORIENTATION=-
MNKKCSTPLNWSGRSSKSRLPGAESAKKWLISASSVPTGSPRSTDWSVAIGS